VQNVVEHERRLKNVFTFTSVYKKGKKAHPKYPIKIFVDSMSDLFHERVSNSFIERVFGVMTAPENRQKIFQILTKREERAAKWPGPWTPNIWMGVTCGHKDSKHRIDPLRSCGAKTKFVSAEPLLTSLMPLDLTGIDWIIVGGESGAGYRPMNMEWAREIRDVAVDSCVPFFFKQDAAGCTGKRKYLVEEDGSCWEWLQFPKSRIPRVLVDPETLSTHLKLYPQYADLLD
jgi:protein gp37